MSSQDAIHNAMIRHQIFVQRFGAGVGKKTVEALQNVTDAAIRRLMSGDLTDFQVDRLRLLGADMQVQFRTIVDGNLQERIEELKDFALYEAEFNQGLLETNIAGSVNLPSPEQISAAVDLSRMKISDGKYLSMTDVFKSFTNRGAQQIAQEISDGAILGETNRQIADRLERLSGLHKNQAMTIARTATNNVATVARNQVMQENEDVLDGYEWVAALDNRTTILCGSLDGQVFSFNDPDAPKPPAHFNCRSTIVPKVKPEFTLGADIEGERPAIGADGKEQIGAGTNYETWLRRQPAAFQDEVLGKDRGKLFRGKKLSLDRFIDAKGNPIPLDQLKALDESFNIKPKARPPKEVPKVLKEQETLFADIKLSSPISRERWEEALEFRLNEPMREAIQKANNPSLLSSERSGLYRPRTKELFASKIGKKFAVLPHEYGHHIDFEMNEAANKVARLSGGALKPKSAIDKKFAEAIKKDKALLFGDSQDQFLKDYKEKYWESYKKRSYSRYTYLRPKSHAVNDSESYLSDIYDAFTKGRVFSDYYLHGHGKKYYRSYENQTAEIFANLFALRNDQTEVGKRARKQLPNLFARFDEMILEFNGGDYD